MVRQRESVCVCVFFVFLFFLDTSKIDFGFARLGFCLIDEGEKEELMLKQNAFQYSTSTVV